MRLNSFTDYSLRALMYVASEPGRRATITEIAAAFDISRHHLVKVVQFLGQQGWLRNVRGRGGGLELACAPERINLGAVVRAAEGAPTRVGEFENAHSIFSSEPRWFASDFADSARRAMRRGS